MAGYSFIPLLKKLGINPTTNVFLINAPEQYFEWLEANISNQVVKSGSTADMVHLFAKSRKELEKHFHSTVEKLKPNAIMWISWYKKTSGITTDVTEDVIRQVVLPTGWVDVKVCAVSDEWSGLKIMKRKELR